MTATATGGVTEMSEQVGVGRVVIVTGASKGIGLATAEQFAARGDRVVLVARSGADLGRAVEKIRADGGAAWSWAGDLTDSAQNTALVDWVSRTVGEPEVCVLSAGMGYWLPVVDTTDEQWAHTMRLNLDAVFFATRALLPGMVARRRGHLVYVSSVLAGRGAKNFGAYGASKAGVASFADSVASEAKRYGIKTTVIYPGSTQTTMRDHHAGRPQTPDITDPELQLSVDDVADAIVWLTGVSARAFPTALHLEPKGFHPDE
jgi:NAD(P)-dependent dehydrogenase (short-subunit alcohol dehydrogenase family)